MKRFGLRTFWLGSAALLFATGCDHHDHEDHDHPHVHTAPHGGYLIELDDHFANVELVHERAEGRLSAYLLDGHAENPLPLEQEGLQIVLEGPAAKALVLIPEKGVAGTPVRFSVTDETLKGPTELRGKLTEVKAKGKVFALVAFDISASKKAEPTTGKE